MDVINQWGGQLSDNARGLLNSAADSQSVMPDVAQAGTDATINSSVNMGGLLAPTVYHGSPHTFDKFDLSKIGTGEGAQAYGHGLYFAENPAVADVYRSALSDHAIEVGGQRIKPTPGSIEDRAQAWVQGAVDAQPENPFQYAKKQAYSILGKSSSVADDIAKQIDQWQLAGAKVTGGGQLYTVDIPASAAANMLHWDKPLSEQPQAVQDALASLGEKMPDSKLRTGAQAYGLLQSRLRPAGTDNTVRDPVAASEALKALGIPGIKYLDQGSRANGGTHNYVLFDDSLAKIINRE